MPRLARLDAPGVIHHIFIRGIERRKIFRDNRDRENFLQRLGNLLLSHMNMPGCGEKALVGTVILKLIRQPINSVSI